MFTVTAFWRTCVSEDNLLHNSPVLKIKKAYFITLQY
jgi:hypothetical protein